MEINASKQEKGPMTADTKTTKKLGFFEILFSLSSVFWVVGAMEMVERLAYYGVKSVAALYGTDPSSKGGLGLTTEEFGQIMIVWALTQSIVPALVGGLADRLGYKETIGISTVVKIAGYLSMAMFPTYYGFLVGSLLLATGTGIFKPGIQGTLVRTTNKENSATAWGIFYQTVNVGGFIGPILAGHLRVLDWSQVFYACAAIISINFLLLLTYKEPQPQENNLEAAIEADYKAVEETLNEGKPEAEGSRLSQESPVKIEEPEQENLIISSLRELLRPVMLIYIIIFSGFWFMFNALFDILPLYIRDWVDTSELVKLLFKDGVVPESLSTFFVTNPERTMILPEGLMNVNAGMIMLTCFFFGYISGLFRATTSIFIGTTLGAISMFLIGDTNSAIAIVIAIAVFSIGEMLSSPKSGEFLGNIAPKDKVAMYLGYTQVPLAIGWTLEAKYATKWFDQYCSKETFAREYLAKNLNLSPQDIDAVPTGEAFEVLVQKTGTPALELTQMLYESNPTPYLWNIMAGIGAISAIAMLAYGYWLKQQGIRD